MRSPRARLLLLAKAAISLGLLAFVARSVLAHEGAGAVFARFSALDARFVAVAVALQCAAVLLGTSRWRILLAAHGMRLRPTFLLRSYLIGRFVAAFTPSTTGLDAYRVLDVARVTGDAPRASQVVLVEKCVGILGLALVSGITALAGTGLVPLVPALATAGLAVVGAVLGLALLARPSTLARVLAPLPGKLGAKVRGLLVRLPAGGISSGTLALTVALGLLGHLAVATTFLATGRALGVEADTGALLVVGNAIVVATLVPISVGGVGVREGVAVMLLARVGVATGDATLVAVLGYLAGQVPALLGGVLAMLPSASEPSPSELSLS